MQTIVTTSDPTAPMTMEVINPALSGLIDVSPIWAVERGLTDVEDGGPASEDADVGEESEDVGNDAGYVGDDAGDESDDAEDDDDDDDDKDDKDSDGLGEDATGRTIAAFKVSNAVSWPSIEKSCGGGPCHIVEYMLLCGLDARSRSALYCTVR